MIPQMELNNKIPREIVKGRRSQSAIYIIINKKLMVDISNQLKKPHAIVSVNALNCFDRVAHPISAMLCSYFGLQSMYISTFFQTIQNIEMYLMTSYGISESFYTGIEEKSF